MNEQQILQGIEKGDQTAFRELVDHYQEMVINACNRFVHNKEDALDISQEVFIKAYHSIDQFRGESRISTWLYRIAVNQSLNFIRDKKRKHFFHSLDLLFNNSPGHPADQIKEDDGGGQQHLEKQERSDLLYKALDTLPKKQRVALTLNKLEELPYKEVAEIMDISVSETGVLINRGKKALQKKMAAYLKKA